MEASPLSQLSPELRNLIYELATQERPLTEPEPALTRVCKQLRAESLPLYYARSFEVEIQNGDTESLLRVLRSRQKHALQQIRQVRLVKVVREGEDDERTPEFERWKAVSQALVDAGVPARNVVWAYHLEELETIAAHTPGYRAAYAALHSFRVAMRDRVRMRRRSEGSTHTQYMREHMEAAELSS